MSGRSRAEAGEPRARLVLLGASNLARDFPTVLATARDVVDPAPWQVFCAAGHGRSYGRWSRVAVVRALPGIADCALWADLAELTRGESTAPPTYGLLTDIGNDLAYGASPAEIAGWVERCLERLDAIGGRTVMTLLPWASLERLPPWKFHLLRRLFFPTHRTTFEEVQTGARDLQERLRHLALRFGAATVEPAAEWFGPDHIHFRSSARRRIWRRILAPWRPGEAAPAIPERRYPRLSRLAWWAMTPAHWQLAGIPLGREQPAGRLRDGTRVWVY